MNHIKNKRIYFLLDELSLIKNKITEKQIKKSPFLKEEVKKYLNRDIEACSASKAYDILNYFKKIIHNESI